MTHQGADRITLNATAQNLLRIVIASYFLAVALNLIPGTSLTVLVAQVLPVHIAEPLSAMIVFALAFMVMIGLFMRPAALVLGLMTFFASYLHMIELGVQDELGSFWHDLVLIAALMLTYLENAPRDQRMRSAIRRKVIPRRVEPSQPLRPRPAPTAAGGAAQTTPLAAAKPDPGTVGPSRPARMPATDDVPAPIDNIFTDTVTAR
ncbi:DoxX family protein [Rhodobacteraceae bacterium W635]|uniref:DoxX family protein n=1 Tax=Nioella halotolerans TaxID=2303578 RepID=UPI000E3B64D3|nr:DoxX family protein [Rhodobacteraceae bacterium W635]